LNQIIISIAKIAHTDGCAGTCVELMYLTVVLRYDALLHCDAH